MADHQQSSRVVPEETIRDVCGDRKIPALGTIEQIWKTDPIPEERLNYVRPR